MLNRPPSLLDQPGSFGIVDDIRDCPVLYAFDHFVHNKQWNEKPLARSDRIAEAIADFNIQLRRVEHTMNQVFELNSVDIKQLISGDDFHVGHEEGRVQLCVGDACLDLAPCDTDLV